MNFIQNRYGISALSKKYKINAVPQEIMIDKTTGEVQVKSINGSTFSYDYIARLNAHIDIFKFVSYNADVYGNVYSVEIGNKDLPCCVDKMVNLLDSDLALSDTFKSFIISMDLDILNPSTEISNIDNMEIPIKIVLSYDNNNVSEEMVVINSISRIGRNVFTRNMFPSDIRGLKVSSIEILNDDLLDGHESFILHSILINIE